MPASKIVCPDCKAVLKPAKPVPDGKKVVCPKCKGSFVTPGAVEDDNGAARKQAISKQPAARGQAGKKAAAPPPPPQPSKSSDDDDDDAAAGGTYGVIKTDEEKEAEEKPDITYAPDMSIRDLRGPAQAAIVSPSNGLMVTGTIVILGGLLWIAIQVWPFIFSEYVVDHEKFLYDYYSRKSDKKEQERAKNLPKERKDVTEQEKDLLEEQTDWEVKTRTLWACGTFVVILAAAFMIIGAVKMQNVESYAWSMAGGILGLFLVISVPFGIWTLVVLRDEKVIAGFNYSPE
jgi:DNA-directed RNA polymerase subunit M/transcription elongation factor TFIIS